MPLDTNQETTTVQQEIIDLLQYGRISSVEIIETQPLDRSEYPERWAKQIGDEAYNVFYRAEKNIAPWDRREVGTRRAQVARLLRPRGVMGSLRDVEEEPIHIEIDPAKAVPAPEELEALGPF